MTSRMLAIYPQTAKSNIHVFYVLYTSAWDHPCLPIHEGRKTTQTQQKKKQIETGPYWWPWMRSVLFFLSIQKWLRPQNKNWCGSPCHLFFCPGRTQLISMIHVPPAATTLLTTPCICRLFVVLVVVIWMDFIATAQGQKIQVWYRCPSGLCWMTIKTKRKRYKWSRPSQITATISRPTTDLVLQSMTIKSKRYKWSRPPKI